MGGARSCGVARARSNRPLRNQERSPHQSSYQTPMHKQTRAERKYESLLCNYIVEMHLHLDQPLQLHIHAFWHPVHIQTIWSLNFRGEHCIGIYIFLETFKSNHNLPRHPFKMFSLVLPTPSDASLPNVSIDFSSCSLTLIVSRPLKFNISFYLNNVSYQIEFESRVQLHRTPQISACSIVSKDQACNSGQHQIQTNR